MEKIGSKKHPDRLVDIVVNCRLNEGSNPDIFPESSLIPDCLWDSLNHVSI
jgi:hypothetical protein